jgi:hypothetical protein
MLMPSARCSTITPMGTDTGSLVGTAVGATLAVAVAMLAAGFTAVVHEARAVEARRPSNNRKTTDLRIFISPS